MKTLKTPVLLLSSFLFVFISCNKDDKNNSVQPTTELSTTVQLSVADDQMNEGLAAAMDAADGIEDGSADMRPVSCAAIAVNLDLKTISIDFGSGCLNPVSGKMRSGKIIIGYTGSSYSLATERTIRFENFKTVDTVTMNGVFTQSNIVRGNNKVNFSLSSSDFTFLFPGGKTHVLVAYNHNFIVDLGNNIRDISDNSTTISGSSTGINTEGEPYSVTTTVPVVFNGECSASEIFYPVTGAYDIKIGNKPKFNVSWGTGACDKVVTITYLGTTIDVALK
jgi:hypothetical protein